MSEEKDDLESLSRAGKQGFVSELFGLLRDNKKWWLTPSLVVLVLVAILVILGGTGAAPFIYTVF